MADTGPQFSGPPHRAWHAWQCLPRTEKGQPPSIRSIEDKHHIAHGTLNKLFEARAKLERMNHERVERVASALDTTPEWLLYGRGEPPKTAWQIPPWPGPKRKTKSGTMPAVSVANKRK